MFIILQGNSEIQTLVLFPASSVLFLPIHQSTLCNEQTSHCFPFFMIQVMAVSIMPYAYPRTEQESSQGVKESISAKCAGNEEERFLRLTTPQLHNDFNRMKMVIEMRSSVDRATSPMCSFFCPSERMCMLISYRMSVSSWSQHCRIDRGNTVSGW